MKICECCNRKMGDAQFMTCGELYDECRTCKRIDIKEKAIFVRKMITQGYQPEILIEAYYAGGGMFGSVKNPIHCHNNYYVNNFSKIFHRPEVRHHCLCGHYIKNQCYIYNKKLKMAYVIGNCCIERFVKGKRCFKCGAKHQNRITKYCNVCR